MNLAFFSAMRPSNPQSTTMEIVARRNVAWQVLGLQSRFDLRELHRHQRAQFLDRRSPL